MKHAIRLASLMLLSPVMGCTAAKDDGAKQALLNCMSAIQAASLDPRSAKVPYAKDMGSAGEHYFAWPLGSGLMLPTTDGSAKPASASCITNATGIVTDMTINGSEIPIR